MLYQASYPSERNTYRPVNVAYSFFIEVDTFYLLIFSPRRVRGTQITALNPETRGNFFKFLLNQHPEHTEAKVIKIIQIIEDDFDRFYGNEWKMGVWDEWNSIDNVKCKSLINRLTPKDQNENFLLELKGTWE
jgi:hypothetical protein